MPAHVRNYHRATCEVQSQHYQSNALHTCGVRITLPQKLIYQIIISERVMPLDVSLPVNDLLFPLVS